MFENLFQKYISTKNVIFFIVAILLLIFITRIKEIAVLFFAAYVLACSLEPLVDKLSKKFNRVLSTTIVLGAILLIIIAFFLPIIMAAGKQIGLFVNHLPAFIENLKHFISITPILNKSALAQFDASNFISSASDITTKFVGQSINFSINIAQAFIYLIAGILIVFYFLADRDTVKHGYLSLFPPAMKEKASVIIETISEKIGGYVIAQIAAMTSIGIIMAIGLLTCRIEYAILLGLMTALLDIIPVVGPAIALIICLLVTYKAGFISMLLVITVFAIAQIAENNLVRPYIFSKIMNIHPLIIYLFLFITAKYLGVIGVVFAPAIAATVCVLVEELYIKNIN